MLRIKRAYSRRLREEVYALRYRAYRKEDAIETNKTESFEDEFDHQPNHVLWAISSEEKVIASIRTTWFHPEKPHIIIPEMKTYADDISVGIPVNSRIISGNRLVTDPDITSATPQLILVLLRHLLAIAHQKADWGVCAMRINHVAFYQRVLNLEKISDAKIYPGLRCSMHLLAGEFHRNIGGVLEKTPMLKPKGYEKLFFDNNYEDVWETGLPVEI